MPLPSFSSVPKCILNESSAIVGPFDMNDRLFYWHKQNRSLEILDVFNSENTQSVKLKDLPKSYEPLGLSVHISGRMFLIHDGLSAYIVELDQNNNPCCVPVCRKLFRQRKRLRILECRWTPVVLKNTDSCLSSTFCLLCSDNTIRFFNCDSPDIVLEEIDLSDPEDKNDEDGLGLLSDITFDRAIGMDFGKPMLSINCESKKKFTSRIPLFILKSNGDIYCALLNQFFDSPSQLIGPLKIENSNYNAGSYWTSDIICLQSDVPILAIVSKARDCRIISHCVVFFEGDIDDQYLHLKQYESIEVSTASTDLRIIKDPTFNDRYFINSSTEIMAVELPWSWLFSNSLPHDLFDYALSHGAFDAPAVTRMIFSLADKPSSESLIQVMLSRTKNLSEQILVVITDKRIFSIGLSTQTDSPRNLHYEAVDKFEDSNDVLVDNVGLPVHPNICEVEKLLSDLKTSSPPLSLSSSEQSEVQFKKRLSIHKCITKLLEESKQSQASKMADLAHMVNDELLPKIATLKEKQSLIVKKLRTEMAKQSELHDRLIQMGRSIDNQNNSDLTASEIRIRDWTGKAMDKCYTQLWPKVEEIKHHLRVNHNTLKE